MRIICEEHLSREVNALFEMVESSTVFPHVWRGFLILSLLSGHVSFAGTRFAFKPALRQILHGSLSWNHRAPSPSCHHVLGGILMAMKKGVCVCVCIREHCF